jgi:hypothetical protein
MKYLLPFLGFAFISVGCYKELSTDYLAYVINPTTHNIKLYIFSNRQSIPSDTIEILPTRTFELANGSSKGFQDSGFNSEYFSGLDSIRVVFDGLHTMSHYVNEPAQKSTKHYLYTSTRNLAQLKSYRVETEDVSKHARINRHTYTFTEQDYLDAR